MTMGTVLFVIFYDNRDGSFCHVSSRIPYLLKYIKQAYYSQFIIIISFYTFNAHKAGIFLLQIILVVI